MKKYLLGLGVATLILMLGASPSFAKDDAFTKFGRGMANIVISPAELYTQPIMMSDDHPVSMALFGGIMKGLAVCVAREVVGVVEVVTFPLPLPKVGYGPIIKPATTFTDWETRQPQV
jgi:putative exosortase-associated protein (TIGR04073 family)